MKYLLALLLVMAASPSFAEEEECVFDQNEQRTEYLKLQKHYKGSKYVEEEYKLIIPKGDSQIHLRIGGCVHYGVTIEWVQRKTDEFMDESVFFKTIVDLVKEYGQEMSDYRKLKTLLDEKKWNNMSDSDLLYYFVQYKEFAAFEIYQKHEESKTIIGVSFYN